MQFSLVYVTFPELAEARKAVHTLLNMGLIACANLYNNSESIYVWQGEITTALETVAIMKSLSTNVPAITDFLKHNHSYVTPCIITYRIDQINPEFAAWINERSKSALN